MQRGLGRAQPASHAVAVAAAVAAVAAIAAVAATQPMYAASSIAVTETGSFCCELVRARGGNWRAGNCVQAARAAVPTRTARPPERTELSRALETGEEGCCRRREGLACGYVRGTIRSPPLPGRDIQYGLAAQLVVGGQV